MLVILLLRYLMTVEEFTKEVTDHGKHFGIHVKQTV